MKKFLISAALLVATAVHADPWTIDEKTREDCAKLGGCILTLPDGVLIPVAQINQMMINIQKQAFAAGVEKGLDAKTCKGKDI